MKRTSFFLLLSWFSITTCLCQVYVDEVAIDTLNTPYCQLIGTNASSFIRAHVVIDYGQRYVDTGRNRQKVAGPDKQPVQFNSTIDALNFMVRNGWELVSSEIIGDKDGSASTFIYLLQRKRRGELRTN